MGKYDKLGSDPKAFLNATDENQRIQRAIANELAETNRLKREELRSTWTANSYNQMFRYYTDEKGIKHTVLPMDKDKEKFKADCLKMDEILEDQA